MFRNYLQIAYRNLLKHKAFSLINIAGLAIGMAACFFVFIYVRFEKGFDRFHKNAQNLYRVTLTFTGSMANNGSMASNHPGVGPALKRDFPEVVDFARFTPALHFFGPMNMAYTDEHGSRRVFNQESVYMVDSSFFDLFSFPTILGNPHDLRNLESIVLTESTAKKYFGSANPIGKTVSINKVIMFKVVAVIQDPPENSHLNFKVLTFFGGKQFGLDENWAFPEFYTYVQLAPGADPARLEKRFPAFIQKYLGTKMKEMNYGTIFHLQPVTDIHLTAGYQKESAPTGRATEVRLLSYIGVFLLLIAWINYVNLSTAKSVERAKEVGLRKVIGARKYQLISQFMAESTIVNLLAVILAVGLIFACFPFFGSVVGRNISFEYLRTNVFNSAGFWLGCLAIFCSAAFLVGAYPAFVLSRYNPIVVLKGKFAQSSRGIVLRKVLVSFQFVLAILLLAGTITVFRQLTYMRDTSPGYAKDQVVEIRPPVGYDSTMPAKLQSLKSELLGQTGVANFSVSGEIPGRIIDDRNSVRLYSQDSTHNFTPNFSEVDDRFFQTFNIPVIAGRALDQKDLSEFTNKEFTRVMINEECSKSLGFTKASDAIGQRIKFIYGTGELPGEIVGVVANYHQRSLKESFDPILYFYPRFTLWKFLSVRINSGNPTRTLADIQKVFYPIFPNDAFDFYFLNEFFNRQYKSDQQFGQVFGIFTGLAIFVSCLGLLGLTSFVIRHRMKEISVRKVLGASVLNILGLVSKDFLWLVFLASAIALPALYFLIERWLENYAFHINVNWLDLLLPPVLLVLITMLTIWGIGFRAATDNPVNNLRAE